MNRINAHMIASCFLFLSLLAVSAGCSTLGNMSKTKQLVVTYQTMGATLEEAKPAILAYCSNGTLNKADCVKAKAAYNQAVTVYKTLGDAVDSSLVTGDDTRVSSLILQLQGLLVIVNQFLVTQ